MGNDFVDTIVRVYDDDDELVERDFDLRVGDTVCGSVHWCNAADPTNDAFAEYVRAPTDILLRVPPSFKLQDAATLGCALATAVLALGEWWPAAPHQPCLTGGPAPAPKETGTNIQCFTIPVLFQQY